MNRRFLSDLRSVSVYTPELADALIRDLGNYRPTTRREAAAASAERQRQRDAVDALQRAGRQLQKALRRADEAFDGDPPVEGLDAPLERMLQRLKGWAEWRRRGSGRPQDFERKWLRLMVFDSLVQHRIALTRSFKGPAAQVLLAVLEEADRRDGKPTPDDDPSSLAERASRRLSSDEWTAWLAEYRAHAEIFDGSPSRGSNSPRKN